MSETERWREALLRLPDQAFFELSRNYLGETKTPFNKHDMVRQLNSYFRRRDVRESLIAQIGRDDAAMITAITLLKRPTLKSLASLFWDSLPFVDLHVRLVNLAERLIVFRDPEDASGRIWLNPILNEALRERIANPSFLITTRPSKREGAPRCAFSDAVLAALACFLRERPDAVRPDGTVRKKSSDEARRLFSFGGKENVLARVGCVFMRIGALKAAGDGCEFSPDPLESFVSLSERRRSVILALYGTAIGEQSIPQAANDAERILDALGPDRACDRESLRRLAVLHAETDDPEEASFVCEALTSYGLLSEASDGYLEPAALRARRPAGQDEGKARAVLQPTFAILAPPDLPFGDALALARIARLVRIGAYQEYELTGDSVARAFYDGFSADDVSQILVRASGSAVPENVDFMISSWYREHESIRAFRGIVICASEPFRARIEHAEEIAPLIKAVPVPGVFIFDESDERLLREKLDKAGFARVLPRTGRSLGTPVTEERETAGRDAVYGNEEKTARPWNFAPLDGPWEEGPRLRSSLERKLDEMGLDPEKTQELRSRIERGLILTEEQLRFGAVKTERMEARSLDFAGKVRIIEQTLERREDALEVVFKGPRDAPERLLLKPFSMERSGNELILSAKTVPTGDDVRLYVGKLSLVRRVRTSLI